MYGEKSRNEERHNIKIKSLNRRKNIHQTQKKKVFEWVNYV